MTTLSLNYYQWHHLCWTMQKLAFEWVKNLTNVISTQQRAPGLETEAGEGAETDLEWGGGGAG